MRLIDADLLTEKVTKWLNPDPNADRMADMDDIAVSVLMEIEEQPTAFDVDKVIKELLSIDPQNMMSEEQKNVLNCAVEIVKSGVR